MSKIKLNLKSLSISDKIKKAKEIVTALDGNPNFPTPSPPLATITSVADDLLAADHDAAVARQESITKTAIRNDKESTIDRVFNQIAAYVESIAGEDEQKILSAGLSIRTTASVSSTEPAVPVNLLVEEGTHAGQVLAKWQSVDGARSYAVETSLDSPTATSWTHAGVAPKAKHTINNLISGTRYWVRVAAVGTNGQSGWSDPATKIAP